MKYDPALHHRRSVRLRGYDYAQEGMYFVTICTQHRVHFFGDIRNKAMVMTPFGEIAWQAWADLPKRWPHIELGAFQIMPNHMHGVLLVHRPVGTKTMIGSAGATNGADGTATRTATRAVPTDTDDHAVRAALVAAPDPAALDPATPDPAFPDPAATDPRDTLETPFSKIQWATRPYLGQIVGAYKSLVATECLKWKSQNQPDIWLDKIWQRGFHEHVIRTAEAFDNITRYIINNPANWDKDKFYR